MYAANGPEKDILRGVISQSPLIKLVDPPSKAVVILAGIACKVLPNFQLHSPVSVCPLALLMAGEIYFS
jgi:hypothetical protein